MHIRDTKIFGLLWPPDLIATMYTHIQYNFCRLFSHRLQSIPDATEKHIHAFVVY